jgi:nitrogen fixation/metabolism regulation signal transduction histidine kinase
MASRAAGASRFSLGLVARATMVGVLAFAAVDLAAAWRLYATALVVVGFAGLVFFDLRRAVLRADRALGRFVEAMAAGEADRAGPGAAGFQALGEAIDRAAASVSAERAARQQRIDYLQTLADSVPAALMVIETGGGVTLANRAARRLAGEAVARLSDVAAIGPAAAERLTALAPGGREIVRLEDGRQMLASALQFAAPGVEPQRLVALQDVALELDAVELKAWQDLVRVLAHEMMNSLTPISSLAESLQGRPDQTPEAAAAIEVIARRSLGLMTFVDGYRKMAEIPRPALAPIALADFVAALDRLMRPMFEAAGVAYRSDVEPDVVVVADASLLEQAVINLLTNAREAASGVAAASVSLACRRTDGGVAITVADNGPGVAKAVADKLYVPFFTTKPGGSGIGLSIARQIALAHHGQLELQASAAGGAAFTLVLPNHPTA